MKDAYLKKDLLGLTLLSLFVAASFAVLSYFDKKQAIFNRLGEQLFSFIT